MKKLAVMIISIFILITCNLDVYAKDTVYSINKYNDENLNYIEKSYNTNNEVDGYIVGGSYLKKDNYQIILAKYSTTGDLLWKYVYGSEKDDSIDYLTYSYDSTYNVDGYLVVLRANEETSDTTSKTLFLKIDLEGKLVNKTYSNLNENETVTKLIPTYNENIFTGYIGIGTKEKDEKTIALLIKYNENLEITWSKEIDDENTTSLENLDIVNIYEENNLVGYALLTKYSQSETDNIKLLRYDTEGNLVNTINSNVEKYNSYYLSESNNGFILFGTTSDVKITSGDSTYYLIKYNTNNEEEWESIGDIPVSSTKMIKLLPNISNNTIKEYFLSYINSTDNSLEVIKLDIYGEYQKKIKKINNDYYTVENFSNYNDTLYFVGQINCPEDDNCEYNSSSLFLISDEDKVIEVKESDNKNIIIITTVLIILIAALVVIRKLKKNKSSN